MTESKSDVKLFFQIILGEQYIKVEPEEMFPELMALCTADDDKAVKILEEIRILDNIACDRGKIHEAKKNAGFC